ncbi:hypothetical protein [Acidithiobacillus sp.]
MGDEDESHALGAKFGDLVVALLLEGLVAPREGFVSQEVRLEMTATEKPRRICMPEE